MYSALAYLHREAADSGIAIPCKQESKRGTEDYVFSISQTEVRGFFHRLKSATGKESNLQSYIRPEQLDSKECGECGLRFSEELECIHRCSWSQDLVVEGLCFSCLSKVGKEKAEKASDTSGDKFLYLVAKGGKVKSLSPKDLQAGNFEVAARTFTSTSFYLLKKDKIPDLLERLDLEKGRAGTVEEVAKLLLNKQALLFDQKRTKAEKEADLARGFSSSFLPSDPCDFSIGKERIYTSDDRAGRHFLYLSGQVCALIESFLYERRRYYSFTFVEKAKGVLSYGKSAASEGMVDNLYVSFNSKKVEAYFQAAKAYLPSLVSLYS